MAKAKRNVERRAGAVIESAQYTKFHISPENRKLNPDKHKKLKRSMEISGFLPWWPIVVTKPDNGGHRTILDGQHRFALARELGIKFYYIEVSDEYPEFDIAVINDTQRTWSLDDYVNNYADAGNENYIIAREFSNHYGITLTMSLALLSEKRYAGGNNGGAKLGQFVVTHYEKAVGIAKLYNAMNSFTETRIPQSLIIGVLQLIYEVPEFSPKRMLKSASSNKNKLRKCSCEDDAAVMLQEIYNLRRRDIFALKIEFEKARKALKYNNRKQVA